MSDPFLPFSLFLALHQFQAVGTDTRRPLQHKWHYRFAAPLTLPPWRPVLWTISKSVTNRCLDSVSKTSVSNKLLGAPPADCLPTIAFLVFSAWPCILEDSAVCLRLQSVQCITTSPNQQPCYGKRSILRSAAAGWGGCKMHAIKCKQLTKIQ